MAQFDNGDFFQILDADDNPTQLGQPQTLTIAGWVNYDAGSADDEFISIADSVGIRLDAANNGGNVVAFVRNGGTLHQTNSTQTISGSGWHHIAYTVDQSSNTQVLYIDGIAVATTNHTGPVEYQNLGTFVGKHPSHSSNDLDGLVDDLFFFDRALSSTEIEALNNENYKDHDSIQIVVQHNDAPVVQDDSLGVIPSTGPTTIPLSGLLLNDSDPDGDSLTLDSFSQPANGVLVLNSDGDLEYTPNDGFSGLDSFSIHVNRWNVQPNFRKR